MGVYTRDHVSKAIREAQMFEFKPGHISLLAYIIAMSVKMEVIHLESENKISVISVKAEQLIDRVGLALYEQTSVDKELLFENLRKHVMNFFNWRVAVAKGLVQETYRLYQGDPIDNIAGLTNFVGNETLVEMASLDAIDIKYQTLFRTLVGFEYANIMGETNE